MVAKKSEISNRVSEINEILKQFYNIQGNKEMLFLRHIVSCSLYHMRDRDSQLIWQARIDNIESRQEVNDDPFYLNIEKISKRQNIKTSEIWLLCTGEHDDGMIDSGLKDFMGKRRLKVNLPYLMFYIIELKNIHCY